MNEPIGNLAIMTEEQATQIFDFINEWTEKVGLIVVNCEMGIARSVAAAALSKWINGDDFFFYENFYPNSLVYNRVLKAIYGDLGHNIEQLLKKIKN